ncbi:sugar kinase [Microbacterium sp. SD291]|uniref:sugar kinase n=1 Tax=Microbacterium sp. SD291 TaxID=2782007 RepID=UPI001A97201E|nr:sugar kinase [Microbacterium sp. SD291]MBO0981169.1 sugar kinase [Microbacterium sp. SD291]
MDTATAPAVIAIGETMVLIAPHDATPLADAEDVRLSIGGAESNVAAHVAALGLRTAWVSALGDDVLGHRVDRAIHALGVDTRWVRFDADAPTGVYFKDPGHGVYYYRAGSAASRMTAASISGVPLERASIVHISGITPALSPECAAMIDAIIDRVAASPATLSFDVNHRKALWPSSDAASAALLDLARRSDIVFVGLDEAETLWGTQTPDAVRALIPAPARLVVKDGDVGATEFSADGAVFEPAIPTEVVEAVGTGDAFAAGYLAGLLAGEPSAERLRGGHGRAHLVLQSTEDVVRANTTAGSPRLTTGKG